MKKEKTRIFCIFIGFFIVSMPAFCFAAGGDLVWEFETESSVYSTPTVSGGFVYLVVSGKTYCINAQTGVKIWESEVGISSISPAVSGRHVYVSSDKLYCLNSDNGSIVWESRTGGSYSSPAISGSYVYTTGSSNRLYCLNSDNGSIVWERETEHAVHNSTPAISGDFIYAGSANNSMFYCINARTGEKIWETKTECENWAYGSPVVSGGLVYVLGKEWIIYSLNAYTGEKVWEFISDGYVWRSTPAVSGDFVYVSSEGSGKGAKVHCINAKTGSKIWEFVNERGSRIYSPAVSGDFVYVKCFVHEESLFKTYCLNAQTGSIVWEFDIASKESYVTMNAGSPVVSGGFVYVGSQLIVGDQYSNKLYCIEAAEGDTGSWPTFKYNLARTGSRGCKDDLDCDDITDSDDNCPEVNNPAQDDTDGDGLGDECDEEYPELSVEPSNQNVSSQSGTTFITVTNTGSKKVYFSWSAAVISGESWLSIISGSTGRGNGTITVSCTENSSKISRVGTIRVTAPAATNSPIDVTVNQYGYRDSSVITCIVSPDIISVDQRLTVAGEVMSQDGKPIQDALVEVNFTAPGGDISKEPAITDTDGRYEIEFIN